MINYLLTKFENSVFYQKRLINKYKSKLHIGIRNFDEIIELLCKELDLLQITAEDVDSIFWEHAVLDNILDSDSTSLQFKIFEVKRNAKSFKLYKSAEERDEIIDANDNIVIVFEESTEYMTSNCNKILTKMLMLQGVSESDYNNETPEFIWHLRMLDGYLKEYGYDNMKDILQQ